MICQRIGRPPISISGFGRVAVSSPIRVPLPPASMTAFIALLVRSLSTGTLAKLLPRRKSDSTSSLWMRTPCFHDVYRFLAQQDRSDYGAHWFQGHLAVFVVVV